jgi:aminomethyltransferase
MKHTPLYETHLKYNGKMVDFGGWALPSEYEGIFAEYEAVRTNAGLFDVSHMGEYEIRGSGCEAFLQKIVTNDVSRIGPGQIQYSPMCYPNGGTVDDLLIYKFSLDHFLIVVNATNDEKDGNWFKLHLFGDVKLTRTSEKIAQLALQGPKAQAILQKLTGEDLPQLKFFRFRDSISVAGISALISRSGYTGEDGFELYTDRDAAPEMWRLLMEAGEEFNITPCGLGARDTLRLEAGMPLYGNEMNEDFKPSMTGLEILDKGIARNGYPVYSGDTQIGTVTSGTVSPYTGKSIAMAIINKDYLHTENIKIEARGKTLTAKTVPLPFFRKGENHEHT